MQIVFSRQPIIVIFIILLVFPSSIFAQKKPTTSRWNAPRPVARKTQITANVIAELLTLTPQPPADENDDAATTEDSDKPPADNAPLADLIAYWQYHSKDAPPSAAVQQRLAEACANRPDLIHKLQTVLHEDAATQELLYKTYQEDPEENSVLKNYLLYRTPYLRDELLTLAQSNDGEHDPISAMTALAKIDWEAAKPIIERNLAHPDPAMQVPMLALLRKHALDTGDSAQADGYVAKLKEFVANRQLPVFARGAALSEIMRTEWDGQEKYFLSLFTDSTLSGLDENKQGNLENLPPAVAAQVRSVTAAQAAAAAVKAAAAASSAVKSGVMQEVTVGRSASLAEQPDVLLQSVVAARTKWIPKIIGLVGNADPIIHNAAVRFLAESQDRSDLNGRVPSEAELKEIAAVEKDAARALLPWLTNVNWADAPGRETYINKLTDLEFSECVPGLLTILQNADDPDLSAAIGAIREYEDPRAVPALKMILQKTEDAERRDELVTTIALLQGFSDDEMAAAFELYAKDLAAHDSEENFERNQRYEKDKAPLQLSIGRTIYESDKIPATEGLATRLFERIKILRRTQPLVAQKMLAGIERVPLPVAFLNLIERIAEGNVDAETIAYALENRADLQKDAGSEIHTLFSQGSYAAGIAAILLHDTGRATDILTGKDAQSQLALLACARYMRDKLPVTEITALLTNPVLTKAGESYLEIENSVAARNILWARHPNQAWVVGEGRYDGEEGSPSQMIQNLQKEVIEQKSADAVYAILPPNQGLGSIVVRVKQDTAELSISSGKGHRKLRQLTNSELQDLKYLTAQPEIEDLGPESYAENDEDDHLGMSRYTYLRLTKESGRRILLRGVQRAPKKDATWHEQLAGLFYNLRRTGEYKTRYDLEDKIKGLEVLRGADKPKILTVALEGKDLRVMVEPNEGKDRKRANSDEFPFVWHSFDNGNLGSVVDTPKIYQPLFEMLRVMQSSRRNNQYAEPLLTAFVPERATMYIARPYPEEETGLYRVVAGSEPVKIVAGKFFALVATPDDKWLVALRDKGEERKSMELVKINLQTNAVQPLAFPAREELFPLTWIPDYKRVLFTNNSPGLNDKGANFLLDPEAGKFQSVTGDFRPFAERLPLGFKPTQKPQEYWVTLSDRQKNFTQIGRYDMNKFVFTPLLELPGIRVELATSCVDEANGFVYFAHEGNLLRVPLPKK